MYHTHQCKVIATMWPAIDKETVLAKVINMIDTFKINLSHGDEDVKKRYVEIIHKLDNGKSILLDTTGPEIRTKNKYPITLKKWQKIPLTYAEFFKEETNQILIDYANLEDMKEGTIIIFDMNQVVIEITKAAKKDDSAECKVVQWWTIGINKLVDFDNYIPKLPFLGEKDKKHIKRAAENYISMVGISFIKYAENVEDIKKFFRSIDAEHLKIIAKVETMECIENIYEILQVVEGISINPKKLKILVWDKQYNKTKNHLIAEANRVGKPVSMHVDIDMHSTNTADHKKMLEHAYQDNIDAIMISKVTTIAENPIEVMESFYEAMTAIQVEKDTQITNKTYHISTDRTLIDETIFEAYIMSKYSDIKAIVTKTESGYNVAKLACLKPGAPIIAFTKSNHAFRYINILRNTKGYKLAPSFSLDNLHQIGKEIIRILFKWTIALDDKILVINHDLGETPEECIQVYRFKDI